MVKGGGYTIENVYQGGYNTLDPNKAYSNSFTGYRASVGSLGLTTNPNTVHQLKEVSDKLSSGLKNVEIELIFPNITDAIPKQHFTEMRQLSKLVGGELSVHGPVIDTTGMSREGYSELNRQLSERRITDTLLKSHELNPDGTLTVNFHSADGLPSSTWKTLGSLDGKTSREAKKIIAINRENGSVANLEEEKKYYPGTDLSKPKTYTPEKNLEILNESKWDSDINQLFFIKERADQILGENTVQIQHLFEGLKKGEINPNDLTPTQQVILSKYNDASHYLQDIHRSVKALFSKGYEYGDEKQREALSKLSEQYKRDIDVKNGGDNILVQSGAMKNLLFELQNSKTSLAPKIYIPIDDFALEKSSQTYGNAIFNAFDKFKDVNKTPIMLIENPPAGVALSTGEDLKNLIIKSREQFVKRAVEEKNMKPREAEKIAEKLIGATWDVGHINMLRKGGFKDEDIIKETEKIAPYVRHVHLSDNFGLEHTELPMGMGNVPLKEMMSKLGEKGFEAKKIIEAGDWWAQFKTSPIKESLEGLGSPMYFSGQGPYWNQSLGLQQNYFSGYGMILPSNNYQTFGAGFSQLPQELGGEMRGSGGRFSQRGME